jgi:predicted helicase
VADRKDILSGFRDAQRRLVTNARCLTEGVDLPAVDMVVFSNPRRSRVDIVQAVGRAMRTGRTKRKRNARLAEPTILAGHRRTGASRSFNARVAGSIPAPVTTNRPTILESSYPLRVPTGRFTHYLTH